MITTMFGLACAAAGAGPWPAPDAAALGRRVALARATTSAARLMAAVSARGVRDS
jgi:hypothetical protein